MSKAYFNTNRGTAKKHHTQEANCKSVSQPGIGFLKTGVGTECRGTGF